MFDAAEYPVSAVTVEDSRLLVVPADSFMQKIRGNSDYALNMMASMSRHLRTLVRQIEQLAAKSSTQRVASFLVRLCPDDCDSAVVSLPLEKSLIAGRLGMQPGNILPLAQEVANDWRQQLAQRRADRGCAGPARLQRRSSADSNLDSPNRRLPGDGRGSDRDGLVWKGYSSARSHGLAYRPEILCPKTGPGQGQKQLVL